MKYRKLSWLPAFLIMIIIFIYSAKPVDSSNASSMTIANGFMNLYENISKEQLPDEIREIKLEYVNHIVRKGAHVTEYALLACAIAFHLWVRSFRRKRLYILSVLLAATYAASDEIHQIFVSGRGPQVRDVLIDTSGAALGALLFCLIIANAARRASKRESILSHKNKTI